MTTAIKTTAYTILLTILLSFCGVRMSATPATEATRQTITA